MRIGVLSRKVGFSSSFVIHLESWVIRLKCYRGKGERGLLVKTKTTKCRPEDPVFTAERDVGSVALGDRSDRLHGASVNDPPQAAEN
ncbi:hypothetical protein AVEN_225712-1 [Araneus ventricosus]|uniref:Uncharacterized protein n=1 Tax=Araneus ventricosus TaxID=182803 RepID=A0A4Y2QTZ9_ARAVE|nr:hypothetical protein AVEN_70944-1 [Araneus ventricosus]GBN66827.1 hypothetical protein AVEN_225712-1 [Araneus ventricosus]